MDSIMTNLILKHIDVKGMFNDKDEPFKWLWMTDYFVQTMIDIQKPPELEKIIKRDTSDAKNQTRVIGFSNELDKNPIETVPFWTKEDPDKIVYISFDSVSHIMPVKPAVLQIYTSK